MTEAMELVTELTELLKFVPSDPALFFTTGKVCGMLLRCEQERDEARLIAATCIRQGSLAQLKAIPVEEAHGTSADRH